MPKSPLFDMIGLGVSRETQEKLDHFVALFDKWSKTINLVAPSTKANIWHRHIADSAQLFKLLPEPKRWVDLGSGGGFPGIVLAILFSETDGHWVHLVESNHKKAAFLRLALSETNASGSIHPCRIEDAAKEIPSCDVVSARALADLGQLLSYAEPWMLFKPKTRAILHKGRDYQSEIEKARGRWRFDLVIHKSAIEADSVILDIANLERLS